MLHKKSTSLDRYFTFFSVSSAKFNSFVIKAGLEQRILNEAAIFLSFGIISYFLWAHLWAGPFEATLDQ